MGEGHLFHRGSTVVFGSDGYFTKSESLFQSFLKDIKIKGLKLL
ncbi:hypothetical protein ACVKS2_002247 [Pseudomonas sp. PvP125]